MPIDQVVGVDVGGRKKGFHCAILPVGSNDVVRLVHNQTPESVAAMVRALAGTVLCAIDCPPRSQLLGPESRFAERELHRQGYRVQWTRRQTHEPAEWMVHGEQLWRALSALPNVTTIESFPSVAVRWLAGSRIKLPLSLLAEHADRRDWKDFVDAAICADVGSRYLTGEARSVGTTGDELGPIWY
jgi:predicted nuclease with RNAse H fold